MRNLLSTQSALVHTLVDEARIDSLTTSHEDSIEEDMEDENIELLNIENWLLEFLDNLEVLLAERRVDEAMAILDEGDKIAKQANSKQTLNPDALLFLQNVIVEHRQKLADQLAESICQPTARGAELRSAILSLQKLGDGPRAHNLLLNSHHKKLQSNKQSLCSSNNKYGGTYTAALSQLVFSTIAQAARDSLAFFSDEPAYASELVTWAVKETEDFALILKRHVLSSSAASGCLRVAAECVHICLSHCSILEARGLALSPVLLRLFRPFIELAFSANLKRIEQSSAALAAADDWSLAYPPAGMRSLGFNTSLSSISTSQPKLSSSGHRFNSLVQVIVLDLISRNLIVCNNCIQKIASIFINNKMFSIRIIGSP